MIRRERCRCRPGARDDAGFTLVEVLISLVLSSIIATEFDTEPGFVAGAVLVSTLLSPLTLTPILALLGA